MIAAAAASLLAVRLLSLVTAGFWWDAFLWDWLHSIRRGCDNDKTMGLRVKGHHHE